MGRGHIGGVPHCEAYQRPLDMDSKPEACLLDQLETKTVALASVMNDIGR